MKSKVLLTLFLLLLLPVSAMAQDSKNTLIDELYIKSGLEKQLIQLPELAISSLDQALQADPNAQNIPRPFVEELKAAMKAAYNANSLKTSLLNEFRKTMKENELKEVLHWLNSPLGRKFTRLEEAASTPEAFAEMQNFAMTLQKSPPREEQMKNYKAFDAALKLTESGTEVAMGMQFAVSTAIIATLPEELQPTQEQHLAFLEQNRPQIEAFCKNHNLIMFLFTYRNISTEEMKQYIDFASSPTGAKYHAATLSGLKNALYECSVTLGETIGKALQRMEKVPEA